MNKNKIFTLYIKYTLCFLIGTLLLSSCKSAKDILYLQDLEHNKQRPVELKAPTVQVGDILNIIVNAQNPVLAMPFNLSTVSFSGYSGGGGGMYQIQGYMVSDIGTISFPILGVLKVAGLTTSEVADKIINEIVKGNFIKDPVVNVRFGNFKISVLGEVSRPGTFKIENERVSIFDALSLAGDMTIYGRRDNVFVLREENGVRKTYEMDLRSQEVFDSPYFFLKQNDIVFVNPNKSKIQMGGINQNNNVGVWMGLIGTATSVTTFILTLISRSKANK